MSQEGRSLEISGEKKKKKKKKVYIVQTFLT